MSKEEKEMWDWLGRDFCSKCGLEPLTEDSPYYHCDKCRDIK